MSEYFDFLARPKSAWLTVNRGCNFRCKWCYGQSSNFSPDDNMPLETAMQLVQISKNIGVSSINIIGGEPTIWKPLNELISFCKEINMEVGLITNGYRFSDDEYWNEYCKNPCDYVGISVKSGNRVNFYDSTGVDLFDKTMLGIKRAIAFHNAGFSTVYNEIVGSDGLLEIAKQCKEMGAAGMTLSLCSAVLNGLNILNTYSVESNKLVQDLFSLYPFIDDLYSGNITLELFLPLCLFPVDFIDALYEKGQLSSICHVHNRTGIVFDTNGDILPCNTMIGNHIAKYGKDFYDGEGLLTFLNSPHLIDDYRSLLRYPSEKCSHCKWNKRCKGGCILNWTIFDPNICNAVN